MSEERCECCDLPVSSCGKAAEQRLHAEAKAERDRLLARGWLAAQFAGSCSRCGERYPVGTPIRSDFDGWKAACCA